MTVTIQQLPPSGTILGTILHSLTPLPLQTQNECWKLLRIHHSVLETQSINQYILNDNYIQKNYAIRRLCMSLKSSESHHSCSVFKNLLLNCGNEKNPHHPTLLRTFYWLSSSREREAWRSWKLSLNCSPFTHA